MWWRQAAVVVCAAVAVLAGTVTAVAGAVAADETPSNLAGSTTGRPARGVDAAAAYESKVTITLDGPTASCSPWPGARRPEPRPRCGVVAPLPVGTSEADALEALGEPQRRRTLGEDSEAWDYNHYTDEQRYEFVVAVLKFKDRRLVETEQYIFK